MLPLFLPRKAENPSFEKWRSEDQLKLQKLIQSIIFSAAGEREFASVWDLEPLLGTHNNFYTVRQSTIFLRNSNEKDLKRVV